MSLASLPIAFVVPPLNLLPVCLAGLLVATRRRRAGLAIAGFGLVGLWLLATPAVSRLLLASLERGLPLAAPPGAPPEAIVILAGDSADGPAGELGPGPLTLERERAGAALARRTGLPVLVTGGAVEGGAETLAAMMARSLAGDFGVQVRWTEPRATDTWENAADSAAMLRAEHVGSVYLVTHAWHTRRALIAFAAAGMAVTAAPVRLDAAASAASLDLVPRATAWLASYYALHEWIGCADYAWFR